MWFAFRKETLAFLHTAPVVHVCETGVAAPRQAVFATVVDPQTWSAWFPGVREASYPSAPPHGVGTIRRAHVGRTHWIEEMIAWDPNRRWAWTVTHSSVPLATAQVEAFEFADAGSHTRVRWTLALEPRLLARLGGPLAPRAMRRLFRRAMDNLGEYVRRAGSIPAP